jgi:uncharacterized LabA/DUF88 family protein
MTTNVYIDGFNLYYGALKGTRYRWLDLEKLCAAMLPGQDIKRIRYFTAKVKSSPHDPDAGQRQQIYLRALRTLPKVTIHYGHFLQSVTRMPKSKPPPNTVEVIKTEEKGSDVNLATYLVADAFRGDADTFVAVTNDSDLMTPLHLVKHELGKDIGILNPHKHNTSKALQRCSPNFTKTIRPGALASCQLPDPVITATGGQVSKPTAWP